MLNKYLQKFKKQITRHRFFILKYKRKNIKKNCKLLLKIYKVWCEIRGGLFETVADLNKILKMYLINCQINPSQLQVFLGLICVAVLY